MTSCVSERSFVWISLGIASDQLLSRRSPALGKTRRTVSSRSHLQIDSSTHRFTHQNARKDPTVRFVSLQKHKSSPSTITCSSTVTSSISNKRRTCPLHLIQRSRERNRDGEKPPASPNPPFSFAAFHSDREVGSHCVVYTESSPSFPLQQNFILLRLQQLLLRLRIRLQLGDLTLHGRLLQRRESSLRADWPGSDRSDCFGSRRNDATPLVPWRSLLP